MYGLVSNFVFYKLSKRVFFEDLIFCALQSNSIVDELPEV